MTEVDLQKEIKELKASNLKLTLDFKKAIKDAEYLERKLNKLTNLFKDAYYLIGLQERRSRSVGYNVTNLRKEFEEKMKQFKTEKLAYDNSTF